MFENKTLWMFMFCVFNTLFSFALFLKCYFPLKQGLEGHATVLDAPTEPGTERTGLLAPYYHRLVLMVIDAMRADFVLGATPYMPYTRQLLHEGHGVAFVGKTHPPTVTLPRIKSITTGSIPGFVDVVMNFGSTVLTEDNFMTLLKLAGKNLTFFGDDTWLNLFPEHFMRSDGTTSFFVTDYTEVDSNVTRHLSRELAANDWDVMTLHYLGLDHIGHLAGPTSPLVTPKLLEMDQVIEQIFTAMQSWSALESPSLLVICGDHGMSDQGGHGGASHGEVTIPVLLLSPHTEFQPQMNYPQMQQIDLCPSLSVLLGLPIPKNNLGCVQVAALPLNTSLQDKVRAMQLNAAQLARMLERNVAVLEQDRAYQLYQLALQSHGKWLAEGTESSTESLGNQVLLAYQDAMQRMTQRISEMSARYDMYGIILAVTALWLNLFILILMYVHDGNHTPPPKQIGALGAVTLIAAILGHMTVCTSQYRSESLCGTNVMSMGQQAVMFLSVIISFQLVVQLVPTALGYKHDTENLSSVEVLLIFGTVVHTLSLVSSSFVEEEHQTWYFLTSTVHTLLLLQVITNAARKCADSSTADSRTFSSQIHHNANASRNRDEGSGNGSIYTQLKNHTRHKLQEGTEGQEQSTDSETSGIELVKMAVGIVAILCILRVLRRWNQTGNKWMDVPDVGDWLVKPENKMELSWLVIASLVCLLLTRLSCLQSLGGRAACMGAVIATYCNKAGTGALLLPATLSEVVSTQGVTEARLAYLFILVLLATLMYQLQRDHSGCNTAAEYSDAHCVRQTALPPWLKFLEGLQIVWLCVMCLLLRPHNVALVAMLSVTEWLVCEYSVRRVKLRPACLLLYCLAMGQAFFFFQGNSNSLSTVDVSAGYTALRDYQPVLISIQMCLSTYAGVIFWLISCMKYIHLTLPSDFSMDCIHQWLAETHINMAATMLPTRALPLAVYTTLVTFMRYHLFVWTVFSPKLLYEGMLTVVCSVFCVIFLCVAHKFRTRLKGH